MNKVRLRDVCKKASSNYAQKDLNVLEGDFPVYGASGLIKYIDTYHQDKEYVAVVKDGAGVGRTMLLPAKSSVIGTLQYILPKENIIPKYLYYAMKYMHLEKYCTGATIPHIYFKDYEKEEFNLPDKQLQLRMINILERVERIIEYRKQQIEELNKLVISRFVEMFGDPITNPHDWEKVLLSELAEIKIGPFGSLIHKEDYIEGGHPLVNPSHIKDGQVVPDNKFTISDEKFAEMEAYHLQIGDVVLGRRGDMGRCAVVTEYGMLCGTGSVLIRCKGEVTGDYIQKIISFPSYKRVIEDMAVGQTMPNLNVPIVAGFEIIKPPLKVQNCYNDFVEQINKTKAVVQSTLDEMQLLLNVLMQEFFG